MEKELKISNYPSHLKKLEKLDICSNILIGGGDLIKIENFVPLIIGAGATPKIWITIKIANNLIELIKENLTENNQIKIEISQSLRKVKIFAENKIIISAKMINDNECLVDELDLRPIGLNIFGNTNELNIAGTNLSNNSISGAKFLIGME